MSYIFKGLLLILLFSVLFTGCSTHQEPQTKPPVSSKPIATQIDPITMYVKLDTPPFLRGESVTVTAIDGELAITDRGEILLTNLEQERSTFTLHVNTLEDASIKILNIKPKFYNGIWLKTGKYHIEVSKKGYKTERLWVVIYRDKKITIKLQKVLLQANGVLTWRKGEESYSLNGQIFQMQSPLRAEKMTWKVADEYCSNLNISLYGFSANNFALPKDTQLLELANATRPYEHTNALYWTSTTDNEHKSYAKYVNINSGDNSWYKKHGKTYVLCQQMVDVDLNLPLRKIAKSLQDNKVPHLSPAALTVREDASKNRRALNALEMALFLKYGNPIIQNVSYFNDDQVLSYELISQNLNSKGKPYFYKKIRIHIDDEEIDPENIRAQFLDPNFIPFIDFNVVDGKLIFLGM